MIIFDVNQFSMKSVMAGVDILLCKEGGASMKEAEGRRMLLGCAIPLKQETCTGDSFKERAS